MPSYRIIGHLIGAVSLVRSFPRWLAHSSRLHGTSRVSRTIMLDQRPSESVLGGLSVCKARYYQPDPGLGLIATQGQKCRAPGSMLQSAPYRNETPVRP